MANNKNFFIPQLPGLLIGAVIALFLSGKIIKYPQGTLEGGMIGAVGVVIILLASFAIIALVKYTIHHRK